LTQKSPKNKANRAESLPTAVSTMPLQRKNKAKRD